MVLVRSSPVVLHGWWLEKVLVSGRMQRQARTAVVYTLLFAVRYRVMAAGEQRPQAVGT